MENPELIAKGVANVDGSELRLTCEESEYGVGDCRVTNGAYAEHFQRNSMSLLAAFKSAIFVPATVSKIYQLLRVKEFTVARYSDPRILRHFNTIPVIRLCYITSSELFRTESSVCVCVCTCAWARACVFLSLYSCAFPHCFNFVTLKLTLDVTSNLQQVIHSASLAF
jgi:hypothetical protein